MLFRSDPGPARLNPPVPERRFVDTNMTLTIVDSDAVIGKLRDLVEQDAGQGDAATLQIIGGALIARLKALNRAANAAARERKLITAAARQEMDDAHLGMQNLLYEKRHLEREIEKCQQFA